MMKNSTSHRRNLVSRAALVAAFVLAFAAVIFNVNLLTKFAHFAQMTAANAATKSPSSVLTDGIDGLLLIAAIVILLALSLTGRSRKPLPRPTSKHQV